MKRLFLLFIVICLILSMVILSSCTSAKPSSPTPAGTATLGAAPKTASPSAAATAVSQSYSGPIYSKDEFTINMLPQGAALNEYTPKVMYMVDTGADPATGIIVDYNGEFQLTKMIADLGEKTLEQWVAIQKQVNNHTSAYQFTDLNNEQKYYTFETDVLSPKYATAKGIHVGSTKAEVQAAYKGYPLEEHPASDLALAAYDSSIYNDGSDRMNVHSLANRDGNTVKNPFLYFDDHPCFANDYPEKMNWGAIGMIFLFDDNNKVSRIIVYPPTAG